VVSLSKFISSKRLWIGLGRYCQKKKFQLLSYGTFLSVLLNQTSVQAQSYDPLWKKPQEESSKLFDQFLPDSMDKFLQLPFDYWRLMLMVTGGALILGGITQVMQGRNGFEVWSTIMMSLGCAALLVSAWGTFIYGV